MMIILLKRDKLLKTFIIYQNGIIIMMIYGKLHYFSITLKINK